MVGRNRGGARAQVAEVAPLDVGHSPVLHQGLCGVLREGELRFAVQVHHDDGLAGVGLGPGEADD